ncbi:uridylate kinase [Ignisphaera aggregans DSM 17230]|uniref:Uridylate kinase n=1 Tax=Ignisphaera aggregans (strain DSM 17230 / JCM 13409 / AQ1.S1) TaxID=583356 RepID=E0SQ35_IGNAA|nr:uridylate kinase [Ignisphaera aggregans DSM 17230]
MEKRFVLKISGKIIDPREPQRIAGYSSVIKRLVDDGYRVAVVVGGGPYAREYISCAKNLGFTDAQADIIGIEIARVNALLLAYALGEYGYIPIPRNIEDVYRAWSTGKVVVVGGLQPGQSTAAVAMVIAESLGVRNVLYATTVDGIYDKDPNKFSNAKKLNRISIDEVQKYISQRYEAGGYELLDPLAIGIAKRSCIEITVFNGLQPENVFKALLHEIGTHVICHE